MGVDDETYRACSGLRFAEGLRRRSAEARAEAAVQEGVALGSLIGIRVSPEDLRGAAVNAESFVSKDPSLAGALGVWRAAWALLSGLPPLNARKPVREVPRPWPARVASWHRDICSFLVAAGLMDAGAVALPSSTAAIQVLQRSGDAAERAQLAWRAFTVDPPFEYGSAVIGALCAKQILAEEGIEPTGVAVLGAFAAANPAAFPPAEPNDGARLCADAGRTVGDTWGPFLEQSIKIGCAKGLEIARFVQAGTTGR